MDDQKAERVVVVGKLTDEGIECQALRERDSNELYTLSNNGGFQNGDHVKVIGTVATVSFCQQGTTINVQSINRV